MGLMGMMVLMGLMGLMGMMGMMGLMGWLIPGMQNQHITGGLPNNEETRREKVMNGTKVMEESTATRG